MPARIRTHAAVLLGYVCVSVLFYWPLPAHLDDAFLGSISGDTGVYVWNLWVFRHEIVAHGNYPFLTMEVLPLTPPIPLTLHNYTTASNLVGFFLLPMWGVVRTFNMLTLASAVLAAYAMFLLARRATDDAGAAWVAGLAFGFSPYMNARAASHFSLIQAAPLPLFVLAFKRLVKQPTRLNATAVGAVVGWAFLSDPYYAVYCLVGAGCLAAAATLQFHLASGITRARVRWHVAIDLLLVCLAGLIVGIVIRGGGRLDLFGLRVSITHLYTPVMAFTLLFVLRVLLWMRPRVTWVPALPPLRAVVTVGVVCGLLVTPVIAAMGTRLTESNTWISPPVFWRSSAPGLDLLSFFLPNPLHPLTAGLFADGLESSPGGFIENVASVPWTLMALLAVAVSFGCRLPRRWTAWTLFFALLALGPFIKIAGLMTYVPTPWALLRYVPVVGAARMPSRFAILVTLGVAMLAAFALRELRARTRWPSMLSAAIATLLIVEMLPSPRELHPAAVPSVYRIIASDPRDVRVLNLPFGLRDGLSSHGNTTAAWQYFQTVHEKPIMGGYLSRLPASDVAIYERRRVTRVLMDLSAGRPVSKGRFDDAIRRAREIRAELNVGYVVIDRSRTSDTLVDFARAAFDLMPVAVDGQYELYRARR